MTARDIQHALMRQRWRSSFMLPNYTPRRWFECDVFEAMPSGLWREYEIKLSRSDFMADAAKIKRNWIGNKITEDNKHALVRGAARACQGIGGACVGGPRGSNGRHGRALLRRRNETGSAVARLQDRAAAAGARAVGMLLADAQFDGPPP